MVFLSSDTLSHAVHLLLRSLVAGVELSLKGREHRGVRALAPVLARDEL
jgi:hypothetical protein